MSLKKEQKVLLSLLKEIDNLCLKHKIDYYLSPRLTLCAVTGRAFPENPLYGVVLMKTDDMERFRQIVQDAPGEGRALESMKNHKWFPGFYLRYEDTNTLFLNVGEGRDYAHSSLGINIFPLRSKIQNKARREKENFWEEGWLRLCDDPSVKNMNSKSRRAERLLRLRCLTGQGKVAAQLYDNFCKHQGGRESKNYVLKRRKQTITYSRKIFESSTRVMLEGEKFSVPARTDDYLKASYGKNYKDSPEPCYVQQPHVIFSARVSGDELLAEMNGTQRFFRDFLSVSRVNKKIRGFKTYANECWEYASFCAERMNLGADYERRKGYIKNLYKNEDYLRLEEEFRRYSDVMNKSLDRGELFAEDEEIFDIYVDVLSKTGKMVQKEKIDRLI